MEADLREYRKRHATWSLATIDVDDFVACC
jgi:hypothetical protein